MKGSFAVAWVLAAVAAATLLSSGVVAIPKLPDPLHIVMHLGIFAVLGAVLSTMAWRAELVLGAVAAGGLAIEAAQGVSVGVWLWNEIGFDLVVDLLGGMLGLVLAGQPGMAKTLGAWLHPVVVLPVAFYGIGVAMIRHRWLAAAWVAVLLVCLAPAVVAWLGGVAFGRFDEIDLRDRRQRPELFAVATAGAVLYASIAWVWAPSGLAWIAVGLAGSCLGITAITAGGFKVSGHVAGCTLTAVAALPWSPRGAACLVLAGLLVSWARIEDECHTPREVLGAWGLAAVLLGAKLLTPG